MNLRLSSLLSACALLIAGLCLFPASTAQAQDNSVTNLDVTSAGANKLTVSWTNPQVLDSQDSLFIRWRVQNTNSWLNTGSATGTQLDGSGNRNSYEITGLTGGTTYDIEVRTHLDGESQSAWASITGTAPTPIAWLTVNPNPVVEGRSVTVTASVSWALESRGVFSVVATPKTASGTDFTTTSGTLILNAGETSISKTLVRTLQDTEVEDDETFTLRLARVPSTVVGGTISAEVTILDDDFVTPKPTNLRVTQSGSRLSLSWSPPAPPDAGDTIYVFGYEVGYKMSDGSWISHGEILTGGERTFDDPRLRSTSRSIDVNASSPGSDYEVRVRASYNLFRAIDGTTHKLISDWVYWPGTSSGVGGSSARGTVQGVSAGGVRVNQAQGGSQPRNPGVVDSGVEVKTSDSETQGTRSTLVNIATRALVGTGTDIMFDYFTIKGGSKMVLVQAVGPELNSARSAESNALADPVLTVVRRSDGKALMTNDNWGDSQGQEITDAWGGSPNLDAGSKSAAVILTLEPGDYAAIVSGKGGSTGVARVEVYDLD